MSQDNEQPDAPDFYSSLVRIVALIAEIDEYSTHGDLDDIIALARTTLGYDDPPREAEKGVNFVTGIALGFMVFGAFGFACLIIVLIIGFSLWLLI